MVEALKEKKLPVSYVLFEGEQHGFRQAKNIARALEAELYFYSRVFDFELGNPVEPVEIMNEEALQKRRRKALSIERLATSLQKRVALTFRLLRCRFQLNLLVLPSLPAMPKLARA